MSSEFPTWIEEDYALDFKKKVVDECERNFNNVINNKKNSYLSNEDEKEYLNHMDAVLFDVSFEISIEYTTKSIIYAIEKVNSEINSIKGISFIEQPFYDENFIKKVIEDQVGLIRAEPEKYLRSFDKQVEKIVKDRVEKGLTTKELTEAIQETTRVEYNRANLIARDQTGTVFGEQTKIQSKGIGLETYIWETAGDNRVRDTHKDFSGEIRSWDEYPIPGSEIACRCTAGANREEVLKL